jgi:hypothetical protein
MFLRKHDGKSKRWRKNKNPKRPYIKWRLDKMDPRRQSEEWIIRNDNLWKSFSRALMEIMKVWPINEEEFTRMNNYRSWRGQWAPLADLCWRRSSIELVAPELFSIYQCFDSVPFAHLQTFNCPHLLLSPESWVLSHSSPPTPKFQPGTLFCMY